MKTCEAHPLIDRWTCSREVGHDGPCALWPRLVAQVEIAGRWLRRVTLVEGDLVVATGPDSWGQWAWGDRHAARVAERALAEEKRRRALRAVTYTLPDPGRGPEQVTP